MLLSSLQSDSGTVVTGDREVVTKLQENDYRRIILQLQNEIKSKDARIKGVHALTLMVQKGEENCKSLAEKAKNYEQLLRRAEARIAQLNKIQGIGPQTAFNRGVVMPGVSKKDFDLVSQENLRLKSALDHIGTTSVRGEEIAVRNKELSDLVFKLQEDLSYKDHHLKKLESALSNNADREDLAVIPELERKVVELEKALQSKQLFCETLIKEVDKLARKSEEMDQGLEGDSTDGKSQEFKELEQQNNALKETNEGLTKEIISLKHLNEKSIQDQITKIKSFEAERATLDEQIASQREMLEQEKRKHFDMTKDQAELKKKCDGFFQQVVSLNSKQKESEEESVRMKRAFEHLKAEVDEKKQMINLMTESLKSYEDDFRRENEEKAKFQKMVDKSKDETEREKRENMSHMATIKHLEDEFERVSKMLTEERQKGKDRTKGGIFGPYQPSVSAVGAPKSMFPDQRRMIAVADGGGGRNEVDGKRSEYSMPTTKTESASAPSLIECPYCSRSYPYHLIEGHVQDCMEDSLYMDDRD